ncbi:MAG: hypothetical protein IME93_03170 [Proteobacteria bacterium]|nr:hypothetical protein [Pseudomonadota bacterium]
MAVVAEESTEYENAYTDNPPNMNDGWGGRVRQMQFTAANVTGGDATSSLALIKLPPGKITLMLANSFAYVNWTTASATLDLGWDAYEDPDGAAVAADADGLIDGLDVDAVGVFQLTSNIAAQLLEGGNYTFESKNGVTIRATCQDVALAANDDLVGSLMYVQN